MRSVNRNPQKQALPVQSTLHYPSVDIDVLRERSTELLSKFRTVWDESAYQEWCAIQRLLHKII